MNHEPNNQDPPWGEGPPPEAEFCPACGTVCDILGERERLTESCGGCGFTWGEIKAAERCVGAVAKILGVDTDLVPEDDFREAINAVLGEMTDPGNTSDLHP